MDGTDKNFNVDYNREKDSVEIESFKTAVAGWLRNGGDDGVPHMEVFG